METRLTTTERRLPYEITQVNSQVNSYAPQPGKPVLDTHIPEGWKAELIRAVGIYWYRSYASIFMVKI